MNKVYLALMLLFLLILKEASAISLGSLVKKDFATIKANESAIFEILFWNVEEKPYQVKIEVEDAPKDWLILVQPNEFLLSSSSGEEYINLPYLEKPIKATVVKVLVKPENAGAGEYEISLRARAGSPSPGITFFQESLLRLKIRIEGEAQESKIQEGEKPLILTEDIAERASSILSYIIAIIGILVVSALIYKYA